MKVEGDDVVMQALSPMIPITAKARPTDIVNIRSIFAIMAFGPLAISTTPQIQKMSAFSEDVLCVENNDIFTVGRCVLCRQGASLNPNSP